MGDYISRDRAAKVLCMACGNAACDPFECSFYKEMEAIPAADVRHVKIGHYVTDEMGDSSCSECGEKYLDITKRFCPNCGADMREEGSDG